MKIAYLLPAHKSGVTANGIITYSFQMASALRARGHEVYFLTPHVFGSSDNRNVVDLSEFAPGQFRRLWSRLRRQSANDLLERTLTDALRHLKQSIDIQILEMEESFGWSAAVSAASIVRVVVRLHGPWFLTGAFDSSPATTFQDRIEREGLGISRAAIVTSPSRAGLDAVRDRYRLALDNARVIPNPIEPVPPGIQWRLGACAQDRILFIGRFDLLKGADLVLRAFQVLAPRHPNLRLTFAGPDRGLFEEGENLSIGQFIRKHMPELESRIDYLGVVHREELLQLRQQHLFTIVASRFEMFSYAVAEAMASGCPIIASSAGAIPELISDGATGLLFESGSISALVNRCERLFNDHELLNRLGAEAKRFSEERLRPALLAKETEAAYELALKSHRHFN